MTLAQQIATYLAANGIGSLGTDLFYTYYPDTNAASVTVLDTGGMQPDPYIPTYLPTFQIFVRSVDYTSGKEKLEAVRALLHRKANLQLVTNGTYFYYITAMSNGGHLGKNESGKHEFSINFGSKIR